MSMQKIFFGTIVFFSLAFLAACGGGGSGSSGAAGADGAAGSTGATGATGAGVALPRFHFAGKYNTKCVAPLHFAVGAC